MTADVSTREAAYDHLVTLGECRMPGEEKDLLGLFEGGGKRRVVVVTGISSSHEGLGKEGLVNDFNKGAAVNFFCE